MLFPHTLSSSVILCIGNTAVPSIDPSVKLTLLYRIVITGVLSLSGIRESDTVTLLVNLK